MITVHVKPGDRVSRMAVLKIPATASCVCHVDPLLLNLVDADRTAAPKPCECDLMTLMRRGCTCGHLERERDAS